MFWNYAKVSLLLFWVLGYIPQDIMLIVGSGYVGWYGGQATTEVFKSLFTKEENKENE